MAEDNEMDDDVVLLAEENTDEQVSKRDLLPLENAKSSIWTYFGFPASNGRFVEAERKKRTNVFCKLCDMDLSYTGNTTNMITHLSYRRKDEYAAVKKQMAESAQTSKPLQFLASMEVARSSQSMSQPTILNSFEQAMPYPKSSSRWKSLTQSVSYFLAKDMLPISTVNNDGFKRMLQKFDSRYTPPDRTTFARNYLPALYEQEKLKVKKAISSELQYFSVTTDGWTSRANYSYISLTVHYINKNWELCYHLLETAETSEDHTACNLATGMEEGFERWNLKAASLSAAVTDNARNISLAIEQLDWSHVGCFAHTIQLGVQKAMELPKVAQALGRAKRLVSHFNHSCKSSNILRRKQRDLKHAEQCLIQSVPTRWNSAYYMLDRILKQQQPLCATLIEIHKSELMPTDSEISVMEAFLTVMKPIVEMTEVICGEKWVTLSIVKPLMYKLTAKHLVAKDSETVFIKTLKNAVLKDLQTRYTNLSVVDILDKACFLDPRFKSLSFYSEAERERVIRAVEEEVKLLASEVLREDSSQPPAKKHQKQSKFMSLLQDVWEPCDVNPQEAASKEVGKYLCIDSSLETLDQKPLLWWKQYSLQFPYLSKLAKKYLCIPATSVSSERAFSTAGHVINSKRSCLLPEHANMLIFLAHNLD